MRGPGRQRRSLLREDDGGLTGLFVPLQRMRGGQEEEEREDGKALGGGIWILIVGR